MGRHGDVMVMLEGHENQWVIADWEEVIQGEKRCTRCHPSRKRYFPIIKVGEVIPG